MQTDIDPRDLIGHKAVDRNGDKIGTVDEVYLDDATGEPEWAAVRTGIFGRDAFVPLTTSEFSGEELKVPYDKSLIKESPDFGVGQHLSPAQELQLYRYYGLDAGGTPPASATNGSVAPKGADLDFGAVPAAPAPAPPKTEAATMPFTAPLTDHEKPSPTVEKSIPETSETNVRSMTPTVAQPVPASDAPMTSTPNGPLEVTCREERLDITTEWQVTYTARLRKYVTSETVERHVPVVRERVRVERVPVTEGERDALTQEEIAEAVEEVTLREERPMVRKYLVPIERVRLVVERYTDDHVVREELRREHVEIDDSAGAEPAADAPAPAAAQAPMPDSPRPEPLRPS